LREACNRLCQPEISLREIIEIYEYRRVVECFTGRAGLGGSIGRMPGRLSLAATIEIENEADPDLAELVHANERFHLALAALAGTQDIRDQLKAVLEHVRGLDMLDCAETRNDAALRDP
jgi:DNA-binding GntR family transcriptional regulator